MDKKELKPINHDFLNQVSAVLENARKNAKTAVNLSMVYAYYEIGRMIVEEEQQGENRAAYGKRLLQELSEHLTKLYGKGFSVGNLKNIRQFYKVYSTDQIGETVFSQFENLPSVDRYGLLLMRNTSWLISCFIIVYFVVLFCLI